MRKSALVVAALLTMPLALAAQGSLTIKGGVSFATLSNKQPDFETRTGFAAGIGLELGFGLFRLAPELLYVQKGVNGDGSPSSTAVRLDYAEIPILLKVSLPIPGLQPFAYAGPSVGLRLSCKTDELDCPSDTVKDRDYGAVLGAGIKLGGKLSVEGRYNWGLSDLNKLTSGVDSKTRTFLVLVGYSL